MRIPLPKLMRHLREREFEKGISPATVRRGLAVWAWFAKRPSLYRLATALPIRLMALLAGRKGRFRRMPLAGGWTSQRDFPAPQGRTFQAMWDARGGRREVSK
jgi:L-lactate dehydrogenase complex protein LldF